MVFAQLTNMYDRKQEHTVLHVLRASYMIYTGQMDAKRTMLTRNDQKAQSREGQGRANNRFSQRCHFSTELVTTHCSLSTHIF